MTALELIPVPAGTVIRTHDGESMSVLPGAPVWKDGWRVFMTREDFVSARELLQQAFGPGGNHD